MILINEEFEKTGKDVSVPVDDIKDGEQIAAQLLKELTKSKTGVGLAAPQIGINKRVVAVNVNYPLYFINPKITHSEGSIVYNEGCLSYPDKVVMTKRFSKITVEADNLDEPATFEAGYDEHATLECVCVQHEIDHLDGILMFDRRHNMTVVRQEKKIGRNQLVTLKKGDAVKVLKYKKAQNLLNEGWVME